MFKTILLKLIQMDEAFRNLLKGDKQELTPHHRQNEQIYYNPTSWTGIEYKD